MRQETKPTTSTGSFRPSRRSVVKAAGLTGLAAAVGAVAVPGRSIAGRAADTHDAIVIGAGFAGATAARELQARGLRTLLLEGRGRLGGRTWTESFAGNQIEMGGTWVSESQPYVWNELHRHGIPLVADEVPERAIFPTPQGYQTYAPEVAIGRLGELIAQLSEGSREYFPDPSQPLLRQDLLREIDRLTLRDRIQQLNLAPTDALWLTGTAAEQAGGNSSRGSLTQMTQWWSLCDWDALKYLSLNSLRPATGMAGLLQAILNDARPEVRLNSPVAALHDDGRSVRVTVRSGKQFQAPAVVLAVPVNVWRTIRFSPGLPGPHMRASTMGIGVPNGKKVWIRLRRDVGKFYAQSPEGHPLSSAISFGPVGDGQLVTGFSVDPALDVSDPVQVQAALRQFVPEAEVVAVKAQDWGRDSFSMGGWAYKKPGQLTALLQDIQRPHGRIAFATSDIASGWSGFVDGAIESGLVAARSVLRTVLR